MKKINTKELERIFKALANKRRLAIVHYLKGEKEASVGEISEVIRLSFRSTSKHLSVLMAANIVEREQRSSQMFYRISSEQKQTTHRIISLV